MTFTNANLDDALDAAVLATTHIQLHIGDPGAGGTANVATQVAGRLGFVFPAAASQSTQQTAAFSILAAEGPYTHVTGWDALSAGNHQWTGVLAPQETFAGAGTLNVTVTATSANA